MNFEMSVNEPCADELCPTIITVPSSQLSAVVFGLEMSSRTNFESLALREVLGLEQTSLALAKQVLGLAGLTVNSQSV